MYCVIILWSDCSQLTNTWSFSIWRPDVAPSDFFSFTRVKTPMKGRHFDTLRGLHQDYNRHGGYLLWRVQCREISLKAMYQHGRVPFWKLLMCCTDLINILNKFGALSFLFSIFLINVDRNKKIKKPPFYPLYYYLCNIQVNLCWLLFQAFSITFIIGYRAIRCKYM